ncbi:beta-1,3-galactosyltransferase 5-like [Xenopus laevis]|uniref:Hexosyltransferase n=1 Tax=Xenopus laevis TaxID=8355 RepID=A0A8J1MPH9_XENLA|nr:beta-1,3-galactosyltransferase 5-like [Xenopus laevis]
MGANVRKRFLSLISAMLVSIAMLLTRSWIIRQQGNKHQSPSPHLNPTLPTPNSLTRDSANLSDGLYTYHLNMSQFQSDFPHLQTYKCSVTLTPQTEQELGNPKPVVIMAIKSHPRSGARRQAARRTWAWEEEVEGYWVKTIFLIAQTEVSGQMELVALESREFGDILQWDFNEGHHNLSLKERCFLEWLDSEVPEVKFIFKGDDDEYVNPRAVVHFIKEHGSSPNTLHGHLLRHSTVMRSTKYAISKTLYSFDKYPSFLSGGGFLFPGTSVKYLHEVAQKIPVFPLDDVYFGFLALAANLTYRHDRRFYVSGLAFNACKYQEALVVHGIDPERLINIWTEVQRAQCQGGQRGGSFTLKSFPCGNHMCTPKLS